MSVSSYIYWLIIYFKTEKNSVLYAICLESGPSTRTFRLRKFAESSFTTTACRKGEIQLITSVYCSSEFMKSLKSTDMWIKSGPSTRTFRLRMFAESSFAPTVCRKKEIKLITSLYCSSEFMRSLKSPYMWINAQESSLYQKDGK